MAKKKITVKSERREIFNLEIAIILLTGIIVILGTAFWGLVVERDVMIDQAISSRTQVLEQNQQLQRLQMELRNASSQSAAQK